MKNKVDQNLPNKPFPNFGALKSVDRRILCSSRMTCDGLYSFKIVKGFVAKVWTAKVES